MPTYDSDSDSWRANDGSIHYSEQEAHKADMGIGKGGGDKTMTGLAAGFLGIFIFGPIIAAKLVGWLWGMLLKLGFVGKIITTLLMLFAGLMLFVLTLTMSFMISGFTSNAIGNIIYFTITAVLSAAIAIVPTAWYFCVHYDAVKLMGASAFSEIIKKFSMILWFGFIGIGIIAMINPVGSFLFLPLFAAAIIYYFKTTKGYREEAAANPSTSATVKKIVFMVVVGILIATGVITAVKLTASNIKSSIEASQATSFGEKLKVGDVVEVTQSGGYSGFITENPKHPSSGNNNLLAKAGIGDIMTVTGAAITNERKDTFIPIDYNGTKGYIMAKYVKLTDKKPTVTTSSEPLFNLNSITESDNSEANAAEEETQNTAEE
jgi:hypothetical protein